MRKVKTVEPVNAFVKLCREKFLFLVEEYGCTVREQSLIWYAASVTFQNSTTAVQVDYDLRESLINVVLMRMIGGQTPSYMDLANTQALWRLVKLRGGPKIRDNEIRNEEDIKRALDEEVAAVRTYANDILAGDFRIFPELMQLKLADMGPGPTTDEPADGSGSTPA